MNKYTGCINQGQGNWFILMRSLVTGFIVVFLLAACAGNQAIQPAIIEGSTGMSSSLRSEQGIPKSDSSVSAAPMTGNSPPENVVAPQESSEESENTAAAFAFPTSFPTPVPTESVVDPPAQPTAENFSGVDLSVPVGPQIDNRAPDFTLQTVDGRTISLSEFLGRPVLVNYWATWCVPCKEELPILERLLQEYQTRGLVIISVDAIEQDTTEKVQAIINQVGMTFPTLLDEGDQFASTYNALFFPTSYFIDANGIIRDITLGDSSEEVFRQKIERLLSGEF